MRSPQLRKPGLLPFRPNGLLCGDMGRTAFPRGSVDVRHCYRIGQPDACSLVANQRATTTVTHPHRTSCSRRGDVINQTHPRTRWDT